MCVFDFGVIKSVMFYRFLGFLRLGQKCSPQKTFKNESFWEHMCFFGFGAFWNCGASNALKMNGFFKSWDLRGGEVLSMSGL